MPLQRPVILSADGHPDRGWPQAHDVNGLIVRLGDADAASRRRAARDLAQQPTAIRALATQLAEESATDVREAIFAALLTIGNDAVVEELAVFLRSEEAALRNGAVAVLQHLPEPTGRYMQDLLTDADPDVRIMALNVLQSLAHPDVPVWLGDLLRREREVNVVGGAIDRLAEIGSADMLPILDEVKRRFADEPYIEFAIDTVVRRILGGPKAA